MKLVNFLEEEGYDLRSTGSNLRMLCPLHEGDTEPSFHIYVESDSFYCFSCKRGGGLVSFLMYRDGLSYEDALKKSGQSVNIDEKVERILSDIQLKKHGEKSDIRSLREQSIKLRELMLQGHFKEAGSLYEQVLLRILY